MSGASSLRQTQWHGSLSERAREDSNWWCDRTSEISIVVRCCDLEEVIKLAQTVQPVPPSYMGFVMHLDCSFSTIYVTTERSACSQYHG
jgi:hypothetical protein